MNDFLARTQEGAAALRRAVSDISAQPQLIASVREDPAVGAGILAGVIAQVEKARTLTRPSALGVAEPRRLCLEPVSPRRAQRCPGLGPARGRMGCGRCRYP